MRARAVAVVVTCMVLSSVALLVSGAAPLDDESVPTDANLAMQQARTWHSATRLLDGSVLVAGGSDRRVLAASEHYLPDAGFQPTGRLDQARGLHTATLLEDGRVLIAGGVGKAARASAELFDPGSDRFEPTGPLHRARAMHTATRLDDGQVLVIGGVRLGREGRALASVERYDPGRERFVRAGSLREPRMSHTATLLGDGRVLVAGGLAGPDAALATAEVYDPVTGDSTATGSMSEARVGHTATRLEDGRVLIVGGSDGTRAPTPSAELYDPATGTFESVSAPGAARSGHTATLLQDGRVLFLGGSEGTACEVYDPVAGFATAGDLQTVRVSHQATLLADGSVLVTGGHGRLFGIIGWAEIFDPSVMRVIASGPVPEGFDEPGAAATPAPLPTLGATGVGGRVELPRSGFAITLPEGWTVEVVEPEPDVTSAAAGTAWEVLRGRSQDGQQACSVSIGVATTSLRRGTGVGSGTDVVEPSWDPDEPTTLWLPEPRLSPEPGGTAGTLTSRERLHRDEPALRHDVLYGITCAAASTGRGDEVDEALNAITESLELLPLED